MGDVVMALVILGFFALCVGYVGWCSRIIGPDPAELDDEATGGATTDAAADAIPVGASR